MGNKNSNLHAAKKAKCDEFYTQYADIESELKHYTPQFEGKTVYCNCDNPDYSNFTKYFKDNFDTLKLKRLISTGYDANGHGKVLDYDGQGKTTELQGNGDFRSEECVELLKQADIVVTNPPFSLFREYVAQLVQYGKKFLIIGNQNAITYKEIFPYIIQGKLWLGHNMVHDFVQPDGNVKKFGNISWFTNLLTNKHNHPKCLTKTYNETDYPKFDNYDSINVDKVIEIPYNYEGVIGVPITILNDLCSDGLLHFEAPLKKKRMSTESLTQTIATDKENESPLCLSRMRTAQSMESQLTQESSFNVYRIVGIDRYVEDNPNYGKRFRINGKEIYARILIQQVPDCRCCQ